MTNRSTGWILGLALTLAIAPAWAAQQICIATGGTGGVYRSYGGGMAEIINKYVPDTKAVAVVTGGSLENIRLVDKGHFVIDLWEGADVSSMKHRLFDGAAIGLVMGDVAFQAYRGEGKFMDDAKKIVTLFVMYPNQFHIVVKKGSGINKVTDLKGKRISMGAQGSGTAAQGEAVLTSLGIGKGDIKPSFLSFNETADALKKGTIDAGMWLVAPPTSSIMDLAITHDIQILPFSDADIAAIRKAHAYCSKYSIPSGVYRGVDRPVQNPSVWNVAVVNRNMPDVLAYAITKAIFEHQDELLKIHKAAEHTRPQTSLFNSPIPLHPGAVRYLKERGMTVPAGLMAK